MAVRVHIASDLRTKLRETGPLEEQLAFSFPLPHCPPPKSRVCVCVPAIIFKNRTKYAVIPILGDELSRGKADDRKREK